MKYALGFLGAALANNIQNLQFSGHTADSFTVSWDDVANNTDGYTVSLVDFNAHTELLEDTTSASTYTFSGLDAASIYRVNVALGSGNDTYGQAGGVGRTEGEGAFTTQSWSNGAMGNILWPVATTCAYSFSISFGCAIDFLGVSADTTSQVRVVSSDNTTWNVYVSGKAMQNTPFLQWFIASDSCDFTDLSDAAITFTAFDGYASEIAAVQVAQQQSWMNYVEGVPAGRVEQIQVNVADAYRAHCVPTVLLTIPCDASVVNSWQLANEVNDGFDGANTIIGYDLADIWQAGFGLQYSVPEGCAAHNASVSINYVAAPQIDV